MVFEPFFYQVVICSITADTMVCGMLD